jgi:hypothetical protein
MPPSDLLPAIDPAVDEQAQATLLQTFLATAHHFFGSFVQLFASVRDPRCPELIRYPLAALLFAGVLLFVCRLGARRHAPAHPACGGDMGNQSSVAGQWRLGRQIRSALPGRALSAWGYP